ncbi:MAG TPA: glucose 1-dehydrogenase [Vicinamibacterales bacterium]|jgi:NAD(P)-dependent dehydrogenase (short-subunit alcohol dehydrogenase family)|nr:glucose 1-dehydrogenase [Vicinamibacterales bacterium]
MSFKGKAIIVTGATSGIGRAAAEAFAREEADLVLTGRDARVLEELARTVKPPARAILTAVDLADPAAAGHIVNAAVDAFGGVDVLVNCAGIIASGTIESTTDDEWSRMMAVNLDAPFRLMRAAAPHLAARKGAVVNVSSVNGLRAFPGLLAYNVSKAALDHLTRCAALDLAPLGVRVNAINPGVTVTNLHKRSGVDETRYAAFLERAKETHPLGRPGRPEEVAELILFLSSHRSAWMTGETIPIDGGRHLTCLR